MSTTPTVPSDPQTAPDINAPLEQLRQAALNPPQPEPPKAEPTPEPAPEPFKGEGFSIAKQADGVVIELDTGEKFIGKNEVEAMANLAKAKREASLHIRTLKQPPAPPVTPQPPTDEEVQAKFVDTWETKGYAAAQDYLADTRPEWALKPLLKTLGIESVDELKQFVGTINQTNEDQRAAKVSMEFYKLAPDFPNTPEAVEALGKFFDERKWEPTPQNMRDAHRLLVQDGVYKPVTPQAQNQTPTPPPMIQSGGTPAAAPEVNPYDLNVPLDEVRKLAQR